MPRTAMQTKLDMVELSRMFKRNHENAWQEINDLCQPFRGDFNSTKSRGQKRIGPVFDSTAMQGGDTFVNFFKGQLFQSADAGWMRFRPPIGFEGDVEIAQALAITARRVLDALASSNFYVAVTSVLRDLAFIGNSVMLVEEDKLNTRSGNTFGGMIFNAVHVMECSWLTDKAGRTTFFERKLEIPAIEAARQFDDPGGFCRDMLEKDPMGECTYTHIVYMNENDKSGLSALSSDSKKPWVSEVIAMDGDQKIVAEGGFDENPFIVSRWQTVSGEHYGRGRGHLARPDAKGINKLREMVLKAAGRSIAPPLVVTHGSVLSMNAGPNGTVVMREDSLRPDYLRSGTDYAAADQIAREDREQINRAFMTDALIDPTTQPRSAEESRQRRSRALLRLSAPAETVSKELLDPVIDATVQTMITGGALPELVAVSARLGNETLAYEYTSPIFTEQQRSMVDDVYGTLDRRLAIFQVTGDERYIDDIDPDALSLFDRKFSGTPADIFFSDEEIDEAREAKAQRDAQDRLLQLTEDGEGPEEGGGSGGNVQPGPGSGAGAAGVGAAAGA